VFDDLVQNVGKRNISTLLHDVGSTIFGFV
jgi:hypothetical protein